MSKQLRCTHVISGKRPPITVVHMRSLPGASKGEELDTRTELCLHCTGAVCEALMAVEGAGESPP